jgi:hypothetical protein
MWMLRELFNDISGSTVQGIVGVSAVLLFLIGIIAAAIYRIREQQQMEHAGKKDPAHAHLREEDMNRFGEEPDNVGEEDSEVQLSRLQDTSPAGN